MGTKSKELKVHPALQELREHNKLDQGAVAFEGIVAPSEDDKTLTLWGDLLGALRVEFAHKDVLSCVQDDDGRVKVVVSGNAKGRWSVHYGGVARARDLLSPEGEPDVPPAAAARCPGRNPGWQRDGRHEWIHRHGEPPTFDGFAAGGTSRP